MKFVPLTIGCALAGLLIGGAGADPLPMDSPITMGGVETVCTGVGSGKDDPRWAAYPVKVEFSNGAAQFLSGAHVKLADAAGKTLAEFDCSGPWVLLRVPRGRYTVFATIDGAGTRNAGFEPPEHGQKRVELQFSSVPANQ